MEKEIRPGVFISVITRERWIQRTEVLQGEDLRYFVEQCNKYGNVEIVLKHVFNITPDEFIDALRELEPNFNEKEDFYVVRYAPESGIF